MSFTEKKVVEIVDAAKIPREYLTPDMEKIETALKAGITVAGVEYVTGMKSNLRS
jgi:hypothetical protein